MASKFSKWMGKLAREFKARDFVGDLNRDLWKTGNFLTGGKLQDTRDKLKEQELALESGKSQADLMAQQREVAKSDTARNIDVTNRQRKMAADSATEQSRAAAIEKFQAESAGEATLGVSGMEAGSSPYLALESKMGEVDRQISSWFEQANENINISEISAGGGMDQSRLNERSSVANESILRKGLALEQDQYDRDKGNQAWQNAMDVGVGVLQTGLAAYSLGTSVGALGLMGGTDIGGLAKSVMKSPGSLFELGSATKYGQFSGDFAPLQSMFAEGGVFGSPMKPKTISPGYRPGNSPLLTLGGM
jgi:hypothetical protein